MRGSQALMRSCSIEVGDVRLEGLSELLLVQDEQVVETLPAYTPQKPFTAGIGSRSAVRCPQELDPGPPRHTRKEVAELAVVVTDQEARRLPKGRGFPQRLRDPGVGRMAGHSDMENFSALEFDDEEGKERTEEQVLDG